MNVSEMHCPHIEAILEKRENPRMCEFCDRIETKTTFHVCGYCVDLIFDKLKELKEEEIFYNNGRL